MQYKCQYTTDPAYDGVRDGCCHFGCRIQMLRDAGHNDIADRLEANAHAQDWLRNWGKLLYDPQLHGRDPERRRAAAQVVKAMRNKACGYVDAVRAGAWVGAVIG